jgi:hypothetical protein
MAASFSDQNFLRQDNGFQGRVRQAMLSACISISNEGWTIPFHRERQNYLIQIMNAPDVFTPLFAGSCASDQNCIADATQNGTVVLTDANTPAQAALVTDAHISNAVASDFNSYFRTPG